MKLIGGPFDGRDVDFGPTLRVVVREPLSMRDPIGDGGQTVDHEVVTYVRSWHYFEGGSDNGVCIGIPEGMTDEEVFCKLVEGYSPTIKK